MSWGFRQPGCIMRWPGGICSEENFGSAGRKLIGKYNEPAQRELPEKDWTGGNKTVLKIYGTAKRVLSERTLGRPEEKESIRIIKQHKKKTAVLSLVEWPAANREQNSCFTA